MERFIITDDAGNNGFKRSYTAEELIQHIKELEDKVLGKESESPKYAVGTIVYVDTSPYGEHEITKAVVKRVYLSKKGPKYLLLEEGDTRPHHYAECDLYLTPEELKKSFSYKRGED